MFKISFSTIMHFMR